jgi:aspartate aminotransferase-like enzyme
MQLRIPGPTVVPPEILKSVGKPMIDHRSRDFKDIILRVTANLKTLFQTKNDLLMLTSSGTGAMEAAVVNFLSPGDKVLAVSIGVFGERLASIARTYGADVVPLNFEYGKDADPDEVRRALKANPDVEAVLVTHNETSTGVTNDMFALADVINEFNKLSIVDSVSGMGALDLPVDKLGLDVVAGGSQKGWMVPPGLAMVAVSERAWKANAEAKMPRFYFDLAKARKFLEDGETPWTPAIPIFFGFDTATELMLKEGLTSIFERHRKIGEFTRNKIKEMGLELLADERCASNVVTAVKAGDINVARLRQILRDEYEVVIAGGQGSMKGKVFRIGHLGYVTENDINEVIEALGKAIPRAKSE